MAVQDTPPTWTPEGATSARPVRRWRRRLVNTVGLLLVGFGVLAVFSPVEDERGRSCGSTMAIVILLGGEPNALDAGDSCRSEAGSQVFGAAILRLGPGALVLLRRPLGRWWRAPEREAQTLPDALAPDRREDPPRSV
jgi:hypothetical protein